MATMHWMQLVLVATLTVLAEARSDIAIGIDLGTTFSVVAVYRAHGEEVLGEVLTNDQGSRLTPSVVAFSDKYLLVGEAANNMRVRLHNATVYAAKRFIGKQ